MKTIARALVIPIAFAACTSAKGAEGPYLFDLMKKPAYRMAWDGMLKGAKPPAWISVFRRTGNGVATPSTNTTIAGRNYELAHVCKPHDCGDNRFQVLFAAGGSQAWGALLEGGKQPRFFGGPSPEQRDALRRALAE